ncbi:HAMP domain-containing protein [Treponema socranskii]|uniref:methyl-accepting chemotaxis protein n=1 Tax=Treponema socranskii TaxID=53419 RepID=UPI003D913AFB
MTTVPVKKKFRSIRIKLVLMFTLCIMLLIWLISLAVGLHIREENKTSFSVRTAQDLKYIGDGISIFFGDTKNMLMMLSRHPDVRSADSSLHSYVNERGIVQIRNTVKSETEQRLVALFRNVFTSFSEYIEVYLGTRWGGYATSSEGTMNGGYDPRKRGWYALASSANGETVITKAFASTIGSNAVGLSKSVYSYDNVFIGNVTIEVSLDTLTGIIANSTIGRTGYVIIMQDDGVILADPKHPDFNFKTLAETGVPDFANLLTAEDGTVKVDIDGKRWFSQVYSISDPNWKLIAFMQEDEVFGEFYYMIRTMGIIGFALLVIFAVVISLFAVKTLKPVDDILKMLKNISEGDFTGSLHITSNDEFSRLAEHFNDMVRNVRNLINVIQENATALSDGGIELSSNMTETAAAIHEITANVESTKQQALNQAAGVEETTRAVDSSMQMIRHVNENIEVQAASVTQSSAAIEEMVGNIASITKTLERMTAVIKDLSAATDDGVQTVGKASDALQEIISASSTLVEAGRIIQHIADQTNLLAMNAAIEAAHAGKSGKGFAVVASEIRKLATESSRQGKTISDSLKALSDQIAAMSAAADLVSDKFHIIDSYTTEVNDMSARITDALREQEEGSREVLTAVRDIDTVTVRVKDDSTQMFDGSREMMKEINKLNDLTRTITDSMNEMAEGAIQINNAVQHVDTLTQKNKQSIENLSAEIRKFKV